MPRCGLEPGCGMGAAQPGGTVYAISNFMAFILFIIYEKGRKFHVLFRQDIPTILCNNGGPMLNLICLTARRDEKSFV